MYNNVFNNNIEIYNPEYKYLEKNLSEYIKKYKNIYVFYNFDNNLILKNIKILYDNDFSNVFITNVSPNTNDKFDSYMLCIQHQNTKNDIDLIENLIMNLKTYINIINNNYCYYKIKFSENCINNFKNLSYQGFTKNDDNSISQKEICGNFYIKIKQHNILELCIDKNSLIYGEEKSVKIKEGIYNFHTHPLQAYKDNKVKIGWPSAQDYLGFINSYLKYKTIIHVIITIEGVYILTFHKYLSNNYILENYEQLKIQILKKLRNTYKEKNEKDTKWYIKNVNKKKILNVKIFQTIFLDWENINNVIKINYNDNNNLCYIN